MFKKIWENEKFWSGIGYLTLAMYIFGQIAVGYWYLLAQFVYLVSNILGTVRDFALSLPTANKVRDIAFTAITAGLIVIWFVK